MRPLPLALLLTLYPLFAASAAAETVEIVEGTSHTMGWAADLDEPGSFGRAVGGDFDGDGRLDAALLEGALLRVLFAPGESFSVIDVANAKDLDVVPGGAPAGHDAIAYVNATGAHLAWYDAQLGVQTSLLSGGTWKNATQVRAVDLDEDGDVDLLGLKQNGQAVLVLDGTGAPGQFVASWSIQLVHTISAFAPVQWDGAPGLEVGFLTSYGLEVADRDGFLMDLWPAVLPGGVLVRLRQQGQPIDRLLWITEFSPPAEQMLLVLSPGTIDDQLELGSLDAFCGIAEDFDADGDDDVLISHKYSQELLWFENERDAQSPQGPSFTGNADGTKLFRVGPVGESAPENGAWPVVRDFDGDGDTDVLFASDRTAEILFFEGERIDAAAQRVSLDGADLVLDGAQVRLDTTWGAPGELPAGATHVVVDVWQRASDGFVATQPVATVCAELDAGSNASTSVTLPEAALSFEDAYYVRARAAALDGAGAIVGSGPATTAALATQLQTLTALGELPGSGVATTVGDGQQNATSGSGMVPTPIIRRYRRNNPPAPIPVPEPAPQT